MPMRAEPETMSRRRHLSVDDYVRGVLADNRPILARAITLVESNSPAHMHTAQEVLRQLLPHTGHSIRIGITGVPGVGKSTFIEALGTYLCQQNHRLAVLTVDPTSSISKGSILGDKTRMESLAREPHCFIRPSPSGGTLGGVTRKSRETILVCEAAGFDVVLLETVGVGQSEVTVRSMVDFMLLLMIAGAGDELQCFKKGVIELADALVINKADGENTARAQAAQQEYAQALHYLTPFTEGWTPEVYTCSSLTGSGIADIWKLIQQFHQMTTASGVFAARRQTQLKDWLHRMLEDYLHTRFYTHPRILQQLPQIEHAVAEGTLPVTSAAQELVDTFENT
ncbi:methylmalonyl Co-A mutase-associated GTPase MeaB [candidate division KSB3 bacterium]|uniref:Methylmalonyl Co-A mutase-associated GTPase MeaB n=1 Tax=candidate division KSB3 bacterium TaxID=2044937 RepID=A0A9D5Q8I5_9BACT|nr:methylmalonyl Co-A mutase-associated GTPase MeaB [candidate division KSB3 bacterium]MBD3326911.1 methylmalonyl Co-A mutase-associated GTPase MeaB [candidate division KSB3 bacterium]